MKTVKITPDDVFKALEITSETSGQFEYIEARVSRLEKGFGALLRGMTTEQLLDMYVDLTGSNHHHTEYDEEYNYEEKFFGLKDSD